MDEFFTTYPEHQRQAIYAMMGKYRKVSVTRKDDGSVLIEAMAAAGEEDAVVESVTVKLEEETT